MKVEDLEICELFLQIADGWMIAVVAREMILNQS
jgi:hypothetical protein